MHILFQEVASIPDGPAAPLVFRADLQINSALILSKTTGWKSLSCSASMYGPVWDSVVVDVWL